MSSTHTYYAEEVAPGRYDMRQERFRAQRAKGVEHPHDVCATHFLAAELRALCEKYKFDCDLSALPPP